jgi:hypothetical protein
MARLRVRVTTRGTRDEVIGWRGDILRLRLTAPPVEGAANRSCVNLLAQLLGVKRSQISLVAGTKSRDKTFQIEGLSDAELAVRLAGSAAR